MKAHRTRTTVRKIPMTVRHIALRNGVPCSLDKVEVRAKGFVFRGSVLFPLPLPPCDPRVFLSVKTAERAIERTQRLSRKIRESIIRDFIIERFPALSPFVIEANFAAQPYKKN